MLRVFEKFGSGYMLALAFASVLVFSVLMLPLDVHAVEVIGTVPVGEHGEQLSGIVVNPDTNLIYVANRQNQSISVIDGATNNVINTIPVGIDPVNVRVNSVTNMVYVSGGKVVVIDGNTNTVASTIEIDTLMRVGINPQRNLVYVSSPFDVFVINGTTHTIITKIPFLYFEQPSGPAVNSDTNKIYVGTLCRFCSNSYVTVIDGNTNTRIKNIDTGRAGAGVEVNLKTNMIYSPDIGLKNLYVINGTTDSLVTSIPVGDVADMAINPNTNLIYLSSPRTGSILVIDGALNQIIDEIVVDSSPGGVTVNPNTNRLYVTNLLENLVYVIDASLTVPSAPQNLSATVVSSSQINLSWNTPPDDGGTPIMGYKIERTTDNDLTWSAIVPNTQNTNTTYSDTELTANTSYTYRVSAINKVGTSPPSNTASAKTLATISVNAVDVLDNPLEGIWMQLASADGSIIAEGPTPITFDVVQGTQYTVLANNYNQHIFLHWEDDSMDSSRDITPTTNIDMTVTYTITTADQIASSASNATDS